MARRDDAQLKDPVAVSAAPPAAGRNPPPRAGCTCEEFRRSQVCDHVLMAAAVRMVHRMIDIQKDEEHKPHGSGPQHSSRRNRMLWRGRRRRC
jgi:hypothetical protein